MNPLRSLCLVACLLAVTFANQHNAGGRSHNSVSNSQDPSDWVSQTEIDALPTLNDVTLKRLESLTVDEGATLIDQLYHLAQVNRVFQPSYMPNPNQINGYIVKPRGQKVNFNLNTLVSVAKQQKNFGDEELTVLITGLPQSWPVAKKATGKLVKAYMQRYNLESYPLDIKSGDYMENESGSSEENDSGSNNNNNDEPTGTLVVINLGESITDFEQYATLNVERVGNVIGERLVQLTNQVDVPQEIVHVIGHGIAAHVAGVAGRQFTRLTGHKLRRITALDPSRIFAKAQNTLNGLARGDADFVDAIHTSAYGMGTPVRVGNVDFYPNGPDAGVPGADNVVEASLRSVRYFAESVRPGNERNFPAVGATSFQEYKQNNGYAPRAYMGINTNYDVEGDYILQVNGKSPFGRSAPAERQNGFHHAAHESWNDEKQQEQRRNSNNNNSNRHNKNKN